MRNGTTQNKLVESDGEVNLETSEQESQENKAAKGQLTPEDEQIVLDRLRQLGYVD